MARDIEEFLRKAAERRKQQQGAPPPPAPQPPRPAPQRQQRPRPPAPGPVPEAAVEVVRPSGGLGSGVAEHVRQHINTSEIAEHVRHLGEDVERVDSRMEQRLHQRFDTSLGGGVAEGRETAATPRRTAPESLPAASELLQLLRNPRSLRQAIIISEILRRPEF